MDFEIMKKHISMGGELYGNLTSLIMRFGYDKLIEDIFIEGGSERKILDCMERLNDILIEPEEKWDEEYERQDAMKKKKQEIMSRQILEASKKFQGEQREKAEKVRKREEEKINRKGHFKAPQALPLVKTCRTGLNTFSPIDDHSIHNLKFKMKTTKAAERPTQNESINVEALNLQI
jgi:hypothetical protein